MDYTAFTQFNGEPQFTARAQTRPFRVDMGQFYITNVCNLSCEDCCSFNNLQFQGHYTWENSRERVEQWARLLDIDYLCIIGGEPFANPELPLWVENLRRLWPKTQREFSIITNGTYLAQWDQDQLKDWLEQGITLEISCHDPEQWPQQMQWAEAFLSDLGVSMHVEIIYREGVLTHEYCLEDGSRLIALGQHWLFGPSAVRRRTLSGLEFHNSDPATAHSQCPARLCHYFVDGRMYKCPVTATAAALTEQFSMPEDQRLLLETSRYCDPLSARSLSAWFDTLNQPIPQCRLCPDVWDKDSRQPIWPLSKKKPRVARISLDSLTKRQARPASPGVDAVPLDSSSQV